MKRRFSRCMRGNWGLIFSSNTCKPKLTRSVKTSDNGICEERQTLREQALQTMSSLEKAMAAVGLQDHHRLLGQAATRAKHGYAAMAKAAGFEPPAQADDEVGNISVTGDNTYHITTKPDKAGVPGWLAALLAAGALGAGVAGSQLIPELDKVPPPAAAESQLGYTIEIE